MHAGAWGWSLLDPSILCGVMLGASVLNHDTGGSVYVVRSGGVEVGRGRKGKWGEYSLCVCLGVCAECGCLVMIIVQIYCSDLVNSLCCFGLYVFVHVLVSRLSICSQTIVV